VKGNERGPDSFSLYDCRHALFYHQRGFQRTRPHVYKLLFSNGSEVSALDASTFSAFDIGQVNRSAVCATIRGTQENRERIRHFLLNLDEAGVSSK
jgi:hypothetical protein